jgi:hypothetical protein
MSFNVVYSPGGASRSDKASKSLEAQKRLEPEGCGRSDEFFGIRYVALNTPDMGAGVSPAWKIRGASPWSLLGEASHDQRSTGIQTRPQVRGLKVLVENN